jgi:hypothetical protein
MMRVAALDAVADELPVTRKKLPGHTYSVSFVRVADDPLGANCTFPEADFSPGTSEGKVHE